MGSDVLQSPKADLVEFDRLHQHIFCRADDAAQRRPFGRMGKDDDFRDVGREHRACRLEQLTHRRAELGALHGAHRPGQKLEMPLPASLHGEGVQGEGCARDRNEHDPESARVRLRDLHSGYCEACTREARASGNCGERPQLRAQRMGGAEPREPGCEQDTHRDACACA